MKKLLLIVLTAFSIAANIQANPIAQDRTIFGAAGGVRTPISDTLSAYVKEGVYPYRFALEQEVNGSVMLNPDDGSFTFSPVNFPASFQYSVTDASGAKSALATVTILPGPMISSTTDFETDIG